MGSYRSEPTRTLGEVKRLWQACDDDARALQEELGRRDELGAKVVAFEAREKLTDFADELAAAAENARCLMPGRDDGYRARTTPKLEALIQRLEDRADEIRKGRSPAITIARPAPLPSDTSTASLQRAHDQLLALEQDLQLAREQLETNLAKLDKRNRRQQKRSAAPDYFESEAAFHYDEIVAALELPETPSVLAVGDQLRAMHPIDRARLKGRLIAMIVALVLSAAFFTWLALR